MLDPLATLRATVQGTLTRPEIDEIVEHYWRTDDFVHHLPAQRLPPLGTPRRRAKRYGCSARIVTHVLYGAEHAPGCLLVTTPCLGPYDRAFRRLAVAPHVHDSAHIAVVTRGRALFLVARQDRGRLVLITAEVGAGSLVFYPAGAPHTFTSDGAFQVASLQATHKEPERRDFACPSPSRFDRLPHLTYEVYRRPMAPMPVCDVGDVA